MILDLSLSNTELWAGCEVREEAGRRNLLTAPQDAMPVFTRNLEQVVIDPAEVVLTGSMAIWAYLVAFHFLHGKTKRIHYEDGRGQRVLVAAHG